MLYTSQQQYNIFIQHMVVTIPRSIWNPHVPCNTHLSTPSLPLNHSFQITSWKINRTSYHPHIYT